MKEEFGIVDGKKVFLFTMSNKNGIKVKIINYGAIVTSITTPDNQGLFSCIVLGFDSLKQYLNPQIPYFGAIVGRYANRIANGEFTLDSEKYTLAKNNGKNSLHGGLKGLDKVVWNSIETHDSTVTSVIMTYLSPDGEEGYPGNLKIVITYSLNDNNELHTKIDATADQPTPVNLTNHTYFNLTGAERNILDHQLTILADHYTPVNEELIPTGQLASVAGGPMDFTKPEKVGSRIDQVIGGYDHNYVLNHQPDLTSLAAILEESETGRVVEIFTNQPGIQFYSGNFLDGTIIGKGDKVYKKHYGLCLETQHFPDSPNQTDFPNTILRPGEKYEAITIYRFSTR